MAVCPACASDAPLGSRFCPSCGGAIGGGSVVATQTSFPRSVEPRPPTPSPSDQGRFLPGTVLLERYRIYGLLGRGGMGEVYRADDLRLGQTVALKFLPRSVERDDERRARFLAEVRIARQISHTNVCRVYDVADLDGRHFISMEFVDGEDLAALLRRIGRLPRDKAIQIARQLCAGLAAAHDQGILHRDLKPANVMIDGRGRARITDFGLAELAGAADGYENAGTPAYMAPEQLAGGPSSIKSDLYALGLVLYELFTGRHPFPASDPRELARLKQHSQPTTPSSHIEGFDPAVERVILRCLKKDPRERPASALAVAAALPGGDPLAAALAAGETPSPELVAESGQAGELSPTTAWTCVSALAIGLLLVALVSGRTQMIRMVPLPKSPEILTERARTLVQTLSPGDPPLDATFDFGSDYAYFDYAVRHDASPRRWDRLRSGKSPAFVFWYRQSPKHLLPFNRFWLDTTFIDPPASVPGMTTVVLDPRGRLERLERVPAERDDATGAAPEVDWSAFFREAGLDAGAFRAVDPQWTPSVYADRRVAWEGTSADDPGEPIRVEAASNRGRPVFFRIIHPWKRSADAIEASSSLSDASMAAFGVMSVGMLLGGALLARRNVRLGKGDRKGATRLAASLLVACWLGVLLVGHYVASLAMVSRVVASLGFPLILATLVSVFYLALEPYVRRFWPEMIVSWVRLLGGRLRDPLVGRDALFGLLVGVAMRLVDQVYQIACARLGVAEPLIDLPAGPPLDAQLNGLRGPREALASAIGFIVVPLLLSFATLMLLTLSRVVLRRPWLATAACFFLLTVPGIPYETEFVPVLVWSALTAALALAVLFRIGFLALAVGTSFHILLLSLPMTTDPSAWYAGRTLLVVVIGGAVAAYGVRAAVPRRAVVPIEVVAD